MECGRVKTMFDTLPVEIVLTPVGDTPAESVTVIELCLPIKSVFTSDLS